MAVKKIIHGKGTKYGQCLQNALENIPDLLRTHKKLTLEIQNASLKGGVWHADISVEILPEEERSSSSTGGRGGGRKKNTPLNSPMAELLPHSPDHYKSPDPNAWHSGDLITDWHHHDGFPHAEEDFQIASHRVSEMLEDVPDQVLEQINARQFAALSPSLQALIQNQRGQEGQKKHELDQSQVERAQETVIYAYLPLLGAISDMKEAHLVKIPDRVVEHLTPKLLKKMPHDVRDRYYELRREREKSHGPTLELE